MTVASYLSYVARIKDVPRKRRRDAVQRSIERCGLAGQRARDRHAPKGFRQRGAPQAIVHERRC